MIELFPKPLSVRGFTLVELSIVLVILGLLVGGILAGQSLIRSAELRAVTTEFQQYQVALGTFREKYSAMPGDMANATSFWGAQDATHATCIALTTASTTPATCNGDGDSYIYTVSTDTNRHEQFRAWQHLANAGLVAGSFTGVRGAGGTGHAVPGSNTPRSKLANAGWMLRGFGTFGDTNYFTANYGNMLQFGAQTSNSALVTPALKAEDAYTIDKKMDDGNPHLGKVLSMKYAYHANCANSTNDAYQLSNSNVGCNLQFVSGY